MELEKKIDEKIDQLICWVEKHPNKKSQVCDSTLPSCYCNFQLVDDLFDSICRSSLLGFFSVHFIMLVV